MTSQPAVDVPSKIVALIRTPARAKAKEHVAHAIEKTLRSMNMQGVTGLVVSRVQCAFVDDDDVAALVEAWGENLDRKFLHDALAQAANRLVVTSAACSELIFKEVTDYARPGSPWSVKLAGTAFRRDDFTPDAFFDYWTNVHALIGGSVPGVGGYTVSRAHEGSLGEERADAIIQQWYASEKAFRDAQSTEQAKAAWNDVSNYAKTTGTAFWLMTETVIIEPPSTGPGTLDG